MAKRKRDDRSRNKKEEPAEGWWKGLRDETRNSVIGIIFIVLALILVFAATGHAGYLGAAFYSGFHFLFGIGYYLLPFAALMLAVNFFRARESSITTPSLVAGPLFILSGLGLLSLINIADGLTGGFVGEYVMRPMVFLFAPVLGGIILLAVLVITILTLFDVPLRLGIFAALFRLFQKKEPLPDADLANMKVKGVIVDDSDTDEPKEETVTISLRNKPEGEAADDPATPETTPEPKEPRIILPDQKQIAGGVTPFQFNKRLHEAFVPPPLALLSGDKGKASYGDVKANANLIKRTLQNFGVEVEMDEVTVGPSVTRYALKPAESIRLSKIVALQRELEYALALAPIRIEAPIPGKSLVGIEVPNTQKSTVGLASLLSSRSWTENENPLYVALGKGISGDAHFMNIAKMPHILVAGATGSGKSVTIHTIITSLLYRNSPEELRLIMIDPKRVELTLYNGIPHLLTPVITDAKKSILTLRWATKEMDRRYDVLQQVKVRDIGSYHKNILQPELDKLEKAKDADAAEQELPELMPYIVIIIDELADLMQAYPRELESAIVRLAQMSRAVGIHLILSTQRPSVNVITGLIKANVPARVALQVASQIDSRTILDQAGAENLLGAGDMLFLSADLAKPVRIQSAFISENEVKHVVKFLKDNYAGTLGDELNIGGDLSGVGSSAAFGGIPEDAFSDDSSDGDDKYEAAKELVMKSGKASTSLLQRRLGLGYARAARIMDVLEEKGVIGPADGAKPREVMMGTPSEASGEEN